jgi:hypothetical protein
MPPPVEPIETTTPELPIDNVVPLRPPQGGKRRSGREWVSQTSKRHELLTRGLESEVW